MTWCDTELPPGLVCPHCGHRIQAAGDPDGERSPKRGDIGVCIRCAGMFAFTRSLRLRLLTAAERREMMVDARTQRMRMAVQAIPDELHDG